MKRLRADDSEHSFVKVGHRQALTPQTPIRLKRVGVCLWARGLWLRETGARHRPAPHPFTRVK